MSKNTVRPLRFAVFALLACLAGQSARAADDILLGNIASTSSPTGGQNAANLVLGYNVYLEHVNRQGGVHGRKIKLLNKDDGINAEKMLALTDELVADKRVLLLVGFLNTPGMLELVKRNTLPQNRIALVAAVGSLNAPNFYPLRAGYKEEVEAILRETYDTQKKRVALAYFTQTFGPGVAKMVEEGAKNTGVNLVASVGFDTTPDKADASIAAAAAAVAKADPDAVIVVSAGSGVYNFTKKFRETESRSAQIYTVSTADALTFVKVAGADNARGVVISQAVPYPQHNALAVVREYQKTMKEHAPGQPLAFFSLEGFMGAKVAVEALRRAGPNPTREKIVAALNTMKDFDLGDFIVSYTPSARSGSKVVDLTIIGKNGVLYR